MELNLHTVSDDEVEALLLLWSAWKASEGRDDIAIPFDVIKQHYPRAKEPDNRRSARWLVAHGLARGDDEELSGPTGITLSHQGLQTARQIDEFRESARRRRQHLQGELLRWLFDQEEEHDAHYPSPFKFLQAGEDFLGVPYTEDDVQRAAERLQEQGYIKGAKTGNRPSVLRVTVTALGRAIVERGQQPGQHEAQEEAKVTINNYGPSNNALNSNHFSQNLTTGDGAWVQPMDQAITMLGTMDQAGQFETPAAKAEAQELLEEADANRDSLTKDPQRAQKFLERLQDLAGKGANAAMASIVTASVTQAMGMLG